MMTDKLDEGVVGIISTIRTDSTGFAYVCISSGTFISLSQCGEYTVDSTSILASTYLHTSTDRKYHESDHQ